jgi:hypothetical protein
MAGNFPNNLGNSFGISDNQVNFDENRREGTFVESADRVLMLEDVPRGEDAEVSGTRQDEVSGQGVGEVLKGAMEEVDPSHVVGPIQKLLIQSDEDISDGGV